MNLLKKQDDIEFNFLRIPKELINLGVSHTALLLYALLLDRWELSRKNGDNWINKKGEVFLYFGRDNAAEELGTTRKTISKAFRELADHNLIYEKRQGQNKPNRIYLVKTPFMQRKGKDYPPGGVKNTRPDGKILPPNNTEYNNTERYIYNSQNQKPKSSNQKKSPSNYSRDFIAFWGTYPKKEGKSEAFKTWQKLLKEGFTPSQLIEAGQRYANQCERDQTERKFIKKGVNFLRHRTFEDYLHESEEKDDPTKKTINRMIAEADHYLGRRTESVL